MEVSCISWIFSLSLSLYIYILPYSPIALFPYITTLYMICIFGYDPIPLVPEPLAPRPPNRVYGIWMECLR